MTVCAIPPPAISRVPSTGSTWPKAIWDRLWCPLSSRLLPAALFFLLAVSRTQKLAGEITSSGFLTPASSEHDPFLLTTSWAHQTLTILFLATVSTIYLLRRQRVGPRATLPWTLVALGGAYSPTALALLPRTISEPSYLLLADALMVGGIALSWASLWTLRRCFGILPEARGLVTNGPYRLVRHPVYAGEYLSVLGMTLPGLSPLSIGLFLLFCLLQCLRARQEEAALTALFPAYAAYRRRTPALVPGLPAAAHPGHSRPSLPATLAWEPKPPVRP